MNTCGTCKYFGPLIEGTLDDYSGPGEVPNTKYHECQLLKHMNGYPRFVALPAGPIDGSGYRATFCVSEEFGCNQWAALAPTERSP
jgi:hypothetical protein